MRSVASGRVGKPPLRRGPKEDLPTADLFRVFLCLLQMGQVVGIEPNSKERSGLFRAAWNDTEWELGKNKKRRSTKYMQKKFLKWVAQDTNTAKPVAAKYAEATRAEWALSHLVKEWHEGAEAYLVGAGWAVRENGKVVMKECEGDDPRLRIINADETDLPFDAKGRSKSDHQEKVIIDSSLPRVGQSSTKVCGRLRGFSKRIIHDCSVRCTHASTRASKHLSTYVSTHVSTHTRTHTHISHG